MSHGRFSGHYFITARHCRLVGNQLNDHHSVNHQQQYHCHADSYQRMTV